MREISRQRSKLHFLDISLWRHRARISPATCGKSGVNKNVPVPRSERSRRVARKTEASCHSTLDTWQIQISLDTFSSWLFSSRVRFTLLLTIKLSSAQRELPSKEERCTEQSNLQSRHSVSPLRHGRYQSVLTHFFSRPLSSLLMIEWRYAAFPQHRELIRHGDTANNLRAVSFSQASHLSGGGEGGGGDSFIRKVV